MPTTTTGKSAAAKAAKELLTERIALVETLGEAIDTHRQALDAVNLAHTAAADAARKARDAFDAAKAGGWTTAQLHHAGLTAPKRSRARKATPPPAHASADQPSPPDGA